MNGYELLKLKTESKIVLAGSRLKVPKVFNKIKKHSTFIGRVIVNNGINEIIYKGPTSPINWFNVPELIDKFKLYLHENIRCQ